MAIDHREFPASWFAGLPESRYNSRKYGVKAGQDQVFWEQHGWINAQDPRGWVQWSVMRVAKAAMLLACTEAACYHAGTAASTSAAAPRTTRAKSAAGRA